MGADLLLSWLWISKDREPNWKLAQEHLARKILKQPFNTWSEELHDALGYAHTGNDLPPDEYREVRQRLRKALTEVQRAWAHTTHETSILVMGPIRVLITGGMSWGDEPTAAMSHINLFTAARMDEAAGFFDWTPPPTKPKRKTRTP